jgi:excinuclease ABC subunit C
LLEELQLPQRCTSAVRQRLDSFADRNSTCDHAQSDEAFDISTLQGSDAVGINGGFSGGHPDKQSYRRFRIRTKDTPDDFAMMREAVRRRYQRVVAEKRRFPIILLDAAKDSFPLLWLLWKSLICRIRVVALAKRLEQVFLRGNLILCRYRQSLRAFCCCGRFVMRPHRFAVSYHRQLRKKRNLESVSR